MGRGGGGVWGTLWNIPLISATPSPPLPYRNPQSNIFIVLLFIWATFLHNFEASELSAANYIIQ